MNWYRRTLLVRVNVRQPRHQCMSSRITRTKKSLPSFIIYILGARSRRARECIAKMLAATARWVGPHHGHTHPGMPYGLGSFPPTVSSAGEAARALLGLGAASPRHPRTSATGTRDPRCNGAPATDPICWEFSPVVRVILT